MSFIALGTALWLGIITAISPCPLATNIAAISFIGRQGGNQKAALLAGLSYTLGRTLAYVVVGSVIMTGLLGMVQVSFFLQRYMNEILGPILILLGMLLLGWIGSTLSLTLAGQNIQKRAEAGGVLWPTIIGFLFALSFCPVSAGLFFGGLLTLATQQESRIIIPSLYGIGTALPVILFAFLIAFATNTVGKAFNALKATDRWIRTITGILFIIAGLYYCLIFIYEI